MKTTIENRQNSLFEICYSLEQLYNNGFFKTFSHFVNIVGNYQVFIVAELKQPHSHSEKEIVVNIEGVEEFSFPNPVNEEYATTYVPIIELQQNGLIFFPQTNSIFDEESQKYNLNYEKYKKQKSEDSFEEIRCAFEEEFNSLNEEEKVKYENVYEYMKVKIDKALETRREKKQQKEISPIYNEPKLELDPSKFYIINELIANIFSGGPWADLLDFGIINADAYTDGYPGENPFQYYLEWQNLESTYDKKEISLFIETHLFYEGNTIKEKILEFGTMTRGFTSCINSKLRQLKNGVYCPIGKIEYIESLSYSLPVKENLENIIRCIETLPFEKLKQDAVKIILEKFKEKGFETGSEDTDNKQISDILTEVYNLKDIIKEIDKKTDAGMTQIIKNLMHYKDQIPDYINKLSSDHQKRLSEILKDITNITIPFNKEEPNKYIDLISRLGRFVDNVRKDTWNSKERFTIFSLHKSSDAKKYLNKYKAEDRESICNYSEKFCELYNPVRKDPKKVDVTFDNVKEFIMESNKVLNILINRP